MKKFLLSLAVLFFFFNQANAQLTADAGPDQNICASSAQITLGWGLTAIGGTPPYTYSWTSDPPGFTSSAANPTTFLSFSTSFYVTVTDSLGAQAIDSAAYVLTGGGGGPTLTSQVNAPTCFGGTNGMVMLTVTGGSPPFTYLWSNGQTTQQLLGISAGTYSVMVMDGAGCSRTLVAVVGQPQAIVALTSATPASCGVNNGSITVTVSGGTPSYFYQWSNGATTATITNLSAGNYSVTVSDANGCTASAQATVNAVGCSLTANAGVDRVLCQPSVITLGGSPTASGGTPPYFYSWSGPGGFTSNLANPVIQSPLAGTYTVLVTDTAGAHMDTVTLTFFPTPVANAGPDITMCAGNSTMIGGSPTGSGGSGPYSYFWSNGSQLSNPTVTPTSTTTYYSLTLTDANNCSAGDVAMVSIQNCGGFTLIKGDVTCNGLCNGMASVSPIDNNRFLWSNGDTTFTTQNLCTGIYTVTVMDSVLTVLDSLQVFITEPTPLSVAAFTSTDVICAGSATGSIVISVTGGTQPYTYLWNNGSVTPIQQNLPAGTYFVSVIDGNNCAVGVNVTISEPAPITVNTVATAESASNACDASIDLTVSGGVPPYAYLWSNAANTEDITGLCVGSYTVTITDNNGCTATASDVASAACPNNTIILSISSTGDIDCTHPSDTLTALASGGTPPYSYLWSNSASSSSIITSQAGVYTVWVTDSVGCVRSASDTVLNLGLVVTLKSATAVACNGTNNGKIKVAVSGGLAPYTFLWSNGATADSIINVPSANYAVTVTDAASCTATFTYFLNQNSSNWSYYVYVTSTNANCTNNGSATAFPQGGTSPFTYLWNTVPPQTTQTITGLAAGSYTVTVTGSDGCTRVGQTYIHTSCYNIIRGRIINDRNGNCILDGNETPLSYHSIVADGTTDYYGYTDALGYYTIYVSQAGTYNVRPYFYGNCVAPCSQQNASHTQTFPSLGDTASNVDFYLVQAPFDLYVYPSWTAFRPGFTRTYLLYYGNIGTDTVNGTLTFTYDADITFISASHSGVHNSANRTITWTFADINPVANNYYNYYYYSYVSANFLTPIGTPVGTAITNTAVITGPSPECDTINNRYSVTTNVTNSQDPNEKEVYPAGDIYDASDSILTYTIHFQNTGNDTAWFVVLKDTLSAHLNPASVQNISSSHPITEFKIEGEGILTWVFNPIYLVDSLTNEEGSKGYVSFRVKKKSGLVVGTQIKNTAHIYFDYNEAVVTNTVTNAIASPVSVFNSSSDKNISVAAMPNPFSQQTQIVVQGINSSFDFELFDVTGKVVKKISSITGNRFELQREDMSAGVYFYRITTAEKQRAFGRVVVE